jgi:hypothetical protein
MMTPRFFMVSVNNFNRIKNELLFVVPAVLTNDTKNSIFCAGYLRRPISKIKATDTKIVFLVPVG